MGFSQSPMTSMLDIVTTPQELCFRPFLTFLSCTLLPGSLFFFAGTIAKKNVIPFQE